MTDEYELAETLGAAAAHELAAGEMGEYLKRDKLDTNDGEEVAKLLPDYQEVIGHFDAYSTMIEEIGEDASPVTPNLSYRDEHFPEDQTVSEEEALLMGYALEKMARENAIEAKEKVEGTVYSFLANGRTGTRQDSLSDIAAEENEEMQDIGERLTSEDYGVEESKLEDIETLEDVSEALA